jgi:AAA domain, putative AbiEii toxin, Type IV TA system
MTKGLPKSQRAGSGGFLQRLVLENVRAFKDLDLDFRLDDGNTRKWTYLMGLNGNGKSTVLRSIALVTAGSEALAGLLLTPDEWIRNGSSSARISAELVTAEGEERRVSLELHRGDTIRAVYSRNESTLDLLDKALAHANRSYLTIGYGVHRRAAPKDRPTNSSRFSNPRAQSVATLFSSDAFLQPIEAWAMDLDYRSNGGLSMVATTLNRLLPGIKFLKIDKERRQLIFRTPDGSIPFDQLSDGYQDVATWSGDLLARITDTFADRRNPLTARGLLLIDEVGLHLHPRWQRQLSDFLEALLPNFQMVVTTHSPLTAHQADKGELFVVDRPDSKGPSVLESFPGAPRKLLLHQFLMTPAFGLGTGDSLSVQELKDEYRTLRQNRRTSPANKQRLVELGSSLEDLPSYSNPSTHDTELVKLLRNIRTDLGRGANAPQVATHSEPNLELGVTAGTRRRTAKTTASTHANAPMRGRASKPATASKAAAPKTLKQAKPTGPDSK